MITHTEIKNIKKKLGIEEDIIEKDYVIGWILWGIANDSDFSKSWIFKGGTSLKKCHLTSWRFSEDLDFTVINGGLFRPEDIQVKIKKILTKITKDIEIVFDPNIKLKFFDRHLFTEGKIYYKGPRKTPSFCSIKLDICASEPLVNSPVLKEINHEYDDKLISNNKILCYSIEEVFAEKFRALSERTQPRDLYDIVMIAKKSEYKDILDFDKIRNILEVKCNHKKIPLPNITNIIEDNKKNEFINYWKEMLGRQLAELPNIDFFFDQLPSIFKLLKLT